MVYPEEIDVILNRLIPGDGKLVVEKFPYQPFSKIGLDSEGNIVILTETRNNETFFGGSKTEKLNIYYHIKCDILSNEKKSTAYYSVLILKDRSLLYYFICLYQIIIEKIGAKPDLGTFKVEVDKLRMLFNKATVPSDKTILGLWGELLLIETSLDNTYLISAWHKFPNDKIDFNDGKNKLEVKTTTKDSRIHSFSIGQLKRITNSNTLIASIITNEIDQGLSIDDLIRSIATKTEAVNYALLISKVISVLGDKVNSVNEKKYDYATAIKSLSYFKAEDIPRIDEKHIPNNVKNVHFESELEEEKSIKPDTASRLYSFLYQ